MIHGVRLKNDMWRIAFHCGFCGSLSAANVKKHNKDIVIDQIMRGVFPCGYCKSRSVGKK